MPFLANVPICECPKSRQVLPIQLTMVASADYNDDKFT